MINRCVDDAVSNCLRDDLFRLFVALKTQLCLHVADSDLRVGDIDLLQTELNDSMLESMNHRQCLVLVELS